MSTIFSNNKAYNEEVKGVKSAILGPIWNHVCCFKPLFFCADYSFYVYLNSELQRGANVLLMKSRNNGEIG